MAKIKKITFNRVEKDDGVICDRCGQYIRNIWTVEYTDGVIMHFGIECFEKLSKETLTTMGMKTMKKALKKLQNWTDKLDAWERGEITADNDDSWKYEQSDLCKDHYWHGRSFDEYREWMIKEFIPKRLEEAQVEIKRFGKVNFNR